MIYKYNTVTIAFNITSPVAGTLDLSSVVNVRSGNPSMYNIDIKNTIGEGAQVYIYLWYLTIQVFPILEVLYLKKNCVGCSLDSGWRQTVLL